MVATTATQGLRYPQTSDAPCDGDLHVGWFADDVEEKLNSHDVDLARTLSPPTLVAIQSQPVLYTVPVPGFEIAFDVIEQQVGGTFGLFDTNPTEFHFPQAGYYQVGLQFRWPLNPGGAPGNFNLDIVLYEKQEAATSFSSPGVETNIRSGIQYNRTFSSGEWATLSGQIRAVDLGIYYAWTVTPGDFPLTFQSTSARMYAFWVGDL